MCVEVLRPRQPNGVMSSTVSLPNHTFTGQAYILVIDPELLLMDIIVLMLNELSLACINILIYIERVSKLYSRISCSNSLLVLSLKNRTLPPTLPHTYTTPSSGVGLGSQLADCSEFGDLTRSVHIVNIFACSILNAM